MISAMKCSKVFSRKNTAKCQRCFQNAVIVNKTACSGSNNNVQELCPRSNLQSIKERHCNCHQILNLIPAINIMQLWLNSLSSNVCLN